MGEGQRQLRRPRSRLFSRVAGREDMPAGSSRRIVARGAGSPHCRFPVQSSYSRLDACNTPQYETNSSPKGDRVNLVSFALRW